MDVEENNNSSKQIDTKVKDDFKTNNGTQIPSADDDVKAKALGHSTPTPSTIFTPARDSQCRLMQSTGTPHPYPRNPKKRLLMNDEKAGVEQKRKKVKFSKNEFIYGNYKNYYGKRIMDKDFHDTRLDVLGTKAELFKDKQVLDIGCNSGHLSIEIAKRFEVKSLIGLDIDRSLIDLARAAITNLKKSTPASTKQKDETPNTKFPFNVKFVYGNYVVADDVLLEIEQPQFDLILCLSVTKWIHLNFCDSGLQQAFRRMFLQLHPGGKLILEPQAFDTYRRRKKINDTILANYNSIKFMPKDFEHYLLSPEVGFASMELMGIPDHCTTGFKRPIQIFHKSS